MPQFRILLSTDSSFPYCGAEIPKCSAPVRKHFSRIPQSAASRLSYFSSISYLPHSCVAFSHKTHAFLRFMRFNSSAAEEFSAAPLCVFLRYSNAVYSGFPPKTLCPRVAAITKRFDRMHTGLCFFEYSRLRRFNTSSVIPSFRLQRSWISFPIFVFPDRGDGAGSAEHGGIFYFAIAFVTRAWSQIVGLSSHTLSGHPIDTWISWCR